MTVFDWVKLAIDVGSKVIDIARSGRKTVHIDEVLPSEYRDRVRMRDLEEAARRHFGE